MKRAVPALRFRYPAPITIAAVVTFLGALPMLRASGYYALILPVPVAFGVWAWRAGTDVDTGGLTIRALLGSRRIPWADVAEFATAPKGRAAVRLTSGKVLTLTAVPADELPKLVAASGREVLSGEQLVSRSRDQ